MHEKLNASLNISNNSNKNFLNDASHSLININNINFNFNINSPSEIELSDIENFAVSKGKMSLNDKAKSQMIPSHLLNNMKFKELLYKNSSKDLDELNKEKILKQISTAEDVELDDNIIEIDDPRSNGKTKQILDENQKTELSLFNSQSNNELLEIGIEFKSDSESGYSSKNNIEGGSSRGEGSAEHLHDYNDIGMILI